MEKEYEIFDAFSSYLAINSKKKTEQSQKQDKRSLNIALHYFEQVLGITLMHSVEVEHLEQYELWSSEPQKCGDITKEAWSASSILRNSKAIKSIFRKAFLTGRIPRDPTALWKLANVEPKERRRPMKPEEFEKILELAEPWFKPVLLMLKATGQRPSGVARLKWKDVNLETKTMYFTSRKGGVGREKRIPFPIFPELKEILDGIDVPGEYVFYKDGYAITGPIISTYGYRLIKKAGLSGVCIYSLRHGFITDLISSGASGEVTRRLVGHSNEKLLKEYSAHLGIDVLENAVTSMRQSKRTAE